MTSLELLSRIVPYGLDYLRNVHIESDLLYKDLVNAVRERFGLVAGFQEEKFKQWTQELRARKESMEHEIAVLGEKTQYWLNIAINWNSWQGIDVSSIISIRFDSTITKEYKKVLLNKVVKKRKEKQQVVSAPFDIEDYEIYSL